MASSFVKNVPSHNIHWWSYRNFAEISATSRASSRICHIALSLPGTTTSNPGINLKFPHIQMLPKTSSSSSQRLFADFPQKSASAGACWQCGKNILVTAPDFDNIHCPNCGRIQAVPSDIDYFTYLGIPTKFNLDELELKQLFRRKQAKVHPDRFTQKSAQEQLHSEDHSTYLNNAYRTLRDPFSRADYLLDLLEKRREGPSQTAAIENSDQTDMELAEQIMELNEQIESMESRLEIEQKMGELNEKISQLLATLAEQLGRQDVPEGRRTMRAIGYFRRSRRLLETKIHDRESTE